VKETMECLGITNFLHQRVLLKEWRKAKNSGAAELGILCGMDIDTRTTVTGVSTLGDLRTSTCATSSKKLAPSEIVLQTVEALELPEDDSLTVGSEVLLPYRKVAVRALEDLKSKFAAVNLVSLQSQGHNSLCTVFRSPEGGIEAARVHADGVQDISFCRSVILESEEDFVQIEIPEEVSVMYGMTEAAR
jgi:hypothetical protein